MCSHLCGSSEVHLLKSYPVWTSSRWSAASSDIWTKLFLNPWSKQSAKVSSQFRAAPLVHRFPSTTSQRFMQDAPGYPSRSSSPSKHDHWGSGSDWACILEPAWDPLGARQGWRVITPAESEGYKTWGGLLDWTLHGSLYWLYVIIAIIHFFCIVIFFLNVLFKCDEVILTFLMFRCHPNLILFIKQDLLFSLTIIILSCSVKNFFFKIQPP